LIAKTQKKMAALQNFIYAKICFCVFPPGLQWLKKGSGAELFCIQSWQKNQCGVKTNSKSIFYITLSERKICEYMTRESERAGGCHCHCWLMSGERERESRR
jgi:hypothetical protein